MSIVNTQRRVAVVGSGISGLAVAHGLAGHAAVTLFEASDYFGGHTHTVDVHLDGVTHVVDTGFLVLNERTYPNLLGLFSELKVDIAKSDMSFSVQVPDQGLEWSGSDLNTVFAQRGNLLRPRFWRMLAGIVRFNRLATALAESPDGAGQDQPIGDFLAQHGFSAEFRDWYFLPMIGCIWSCPHRPDAALPGGHHDPLLPQPRPHPGGQPAAVVHGARRCTQLRRENAEGHSRCAPEQPGSKRAAVPPGSGSAGVYVSTDAGTERFDEVVLASHSDQSLALLADATGPERATLGAIRYHRNRAVLHTDTAVLPRRKLAWAAWNYERAAADSRERASVCLHYLLNRLQPLPFSTPVIVSLNPLTEPRADSVLGEFDYAHPVFDAVAIAAQRRLPALQGQQHTCSAVLGHATGFHEDGLMSALAVCDGLKARWAAEASQPNEVAA